jgi:signal transduction histidine kinase
MTASLVELERQVAARDRTIAKLVERVEGLQARPISSFTLLTQNTTLERVIRNKTLELERQRSELEQALHELRVTQAQLLQAQKLEAIGQLAAGVAHEINTPTQYVSDNTFFAKNAFAKLLGVVEACRAAIAPSATAEDVERAHDSLRKVRIDQLARQVPQALEQSLEGLSRIATLVRAMKEFSHPSGGVKEPVDLNQVIEATVTIARTEWKLVAQVTTEFDPTLPPVPCLRDEISQSVLNMIINAAHAIGERIQGLAGSPLGHIRIRTSVQGEHAIIQIADDGLGIPENIRHRIFEMFFTTKPVGKGTGQGLAISHSIVVEQHHGAIEVESELGVGTTFTIRLPLQCVAVGV